MNKFSFVVLGVLSFISRPHLWFLPLLLTTFLLVLLGGASTFALIATWPKLHSHSFHYFVEVTRSIATALTTVLFLWSFVLIFVFDIGMLRLSRTLLHDLNARPKKLLTSEIFKLALSSYKGSIKWKVFWFFVTTLALLIFPPFAIFFAPVGIGHALIFSALNSGLIMQNYSEKERMQYINGDKLSLISSAVIVGVLALALLPTVIGLIFLIPGVYAGGIMRSEKIWRPS